MQRNIRKSLVGWIKLFGRALRGEALIQIVIEGGVLQDVHGLPHGSDYELRDLDVEETDPDHELPREWED